GLDISDVRCMLLNDQQGGRREAMLNKFRELAWVASSSHIKKMSSIESSLVYAHFGPDAVACFPLVRKLELPMVVALHGYDINVEPHVWGKGDYGFVNRFYPRRLKVLADNGVKFVAVSEAIRDKAIERGLPAASISVKHIGVDTSKFESDGSDISTRRPRIIFVGRLVEKKGCEYLLRSFALVRRTIVDAELVIVGDGPLRGDLLQLANLLNVPVDFIGVRNSQDIRQEINKARVLCMPSIVAKNGDAEGLGIVLLEAGAMGVPSVTSAAGASEAVIDGLTGFSFPEKDTNRMADRLVCLLADNDLIRRMSESAMKFVREKFDIVGCTECLEKYFDEVVASARRVKRS
ncbi:MAG: glycosyltransferase, partial [Polynucleobacter sp.]|nr:glycosyltransferase [Polynucleobacter sp.]